MARAGRELFKEGEALDISVHVFDQLMMEGAMTLAPRYSSQTSKKADDVKEF
jgi:hypothetical protein